MQSGWDKCGCDKAMQTCETVEIIRLLGLQGPEKPKKPKKKTKKPKKTYVSDRMLGPQTSPCQTRFFRFYEINELKNG